MKITVTDWVDDAGTLDLWPVYDVVFGDQPTVDPTDPARRLYIGYGWDAIGPGLSDEQVIMGRRATAGWS